ncbi:uncharacterized protein LOC141703961 [Apium graveolens]|uniref:uncharacterized protein LOC141703961 n=1 Tax=Apium graveolens TaxID=4045 RepID=UPI003D79FB57
MSKGRVIKTITSVVPRQWASNHMTGEEGKFKTLDKSVIGQVKFGDGFVVYIRGKGDILFKCKNGEDRVFTDVFFIPDLCNNIISLGQLSEGGNKIVMDGEYMWVYAQSGRTLMKVKKSENRLYKISLEDNGPMCLMVKTEQETWLWHNRLGHVNIQALELMSREKMARGIPKLVQPTRRCEGCLMSKQPRSPFPSSTTFKVEKKLEPVYAHLCGPITPTTPGGQVLEVEETPVVEHRDTTEQEERTPVQIPRDTTEGEFTKNTDISSAESSEPRLYRPLHEIYNETEMIEMIDEVMLLKVEEPTHYSEAVSEQEWVEAMKTEVEMIEKNNTWELTDLPAGHKPVGLKWVYKLKKDTEGNVVKHKARLVAKGYVQRKGIDYNESVRSCSKVGHHKAVTSSGSKRRMAGVVRATTGPKGMKCKAGQVLNKIGVCKVPTRTGCVHEKLQLDKDEGRELVNATEYRYIVGCLSYRNALSGYIDTDMAGDVVDRRSTGGMCFYLNGNLISWTSQKQRVIALSSCEAEYMAATLVACQSIWLRGLLRKVLRQQVGSVILYIDNKSAIELMKNPVLHGRSKHIDVRFHFIWECIEHGELVVQYVGTQKQKADILTKALGRVKFEIMQEQIGLCDITAEESKVKT